MTILTADRPSIGEIDPPARTRPTPIEMFAAAVAFLLPVAFLSSLDADTWSLRSAILLVVAGVGLPILLSQTRGPKPLAARAATAFLVVGALSGVLSHNHTTAVFGLYGQGTGLLFMAGLAGAWAIGRTLRPEARPLVETALLLGVFVNVGVALLGSVANLQRFGLTVTDSSGRASGLTGNSVLLATLAVLGLALLVPRFVAAPRKWAIPVVALAAAAQLSGTRGALVVMAIIALWAGRRSGRRFAAMLVVLLLIGLGAGSALGARTSVVSATTRAGNLSDWRTRPTTWLSARHSVEEHPLLGIGPGQFRTATSPFRPVSVARAEGPERLASDAHNIFVEYLTTTGLLGLGALLVWLIAALRSARGWLLVAAVAVLAIHLFEPQSVVTTPLAFLALGASGSFGKDGPKGRQHGVQRLIPPICIIAAVAAMSVFLFGEYQARQAQFNLTTAQAQQANHLLPAWPSLASLLARTWLFHGITHGHNRPDYERSRAWRLVALRRDNTDPGLWNDLAELDESLGQRQEALAEYTSALHFNPTSIRAMAGLSRLAHFRCDSVQERSWNDRILQILPATAASAHSSPANTRAVSPSCAAPSQP